MSIFDKKPNERRSPTIGEDERKREMEEVKVKQMGHGSPRKEVINSMGQKVRTTVSRPMDTTRSKSKVNGLWKPKRGNKSNGLTWQEW